MVQLPESGAIFFMLLALPGSSSLTWIILVWHRTRRSAASEIRAGPHWAGPTQEPVLSIRRWPADWVSPFTGAPSPPDAGCAQYFPGC
jgi:hypothetical protein